jgi:ParB/RepB/Spo0J family partition protein
LTENNIIDTSQLVQIDKVYPVPYNPNYMPNEMFEALKENIQNNGLIGSILCREHPTKKDAYEIIDGEHRWKACKELGYTEISIIKLDYNDINAAIQLIRFNREKGYFDHEKLQKLVNDLISKTNKALIKNKLHLENQEFNELLYEQTQRIQKKVQENVKSQVDEYTNLFKQPEKQPPIIPNTENTEETPMILNKTTTEPRTKIPYNPRCTAPTTCQCKYRK